MAFSFFSWLRTKAREAVLGGVSDALEQLDHDQPAPDLDAFRAKLAASVGAKQLAPAADDEPAEPARRGRGK